MRGQLSEAERFALCDCEGGDMASDECSNRIALVERIVQRHIEAALAERLQAADVGACGATGGETGGNAVRTRCDEDSGSYGTCGCPIRCDLDAGHDGEHRGGIGGES